MPSNVPYTTLQADDDPDAPAGTFWIYDHDARHRVLGVHDAGPANDPAEALMAAVLHAHDLYGGDILVSRPYPNLHFWIITRSDVQYTTTEV